MHLSIPVFLSGFLAFQGSLVMAQDPPPSSESSSAPACTFSCPETDLLSWPLAKRPYAIGYNSYYTIFECVYSTNRSTPQDVITEHKCTYNKASMYTGSQALEAAGDNCRPEATPCPSTSEPSDSGSESSEHSSSSESNPTTITPPLFSHMDGEEVVPWIEGGRYLLYLIEHPPS